MGAGQVPYDHDLLRQASSLLRRLPAMESKQFKEEYLTVQACCKAVHLQGMRLCVLTAANGYLRTLVETIISVTRQVASFVVMYEGEITRLWTVLQEYSDAMLSLMMSTVTKGLYNVNEMVDKFTLAYDRLGRRRNPI